MDELDLHGRRGEGGVEKHIQALIKKIAYDAEMY